MPRIIMIILAACVVLGAANPKPSKVELERRIAAADADLNRFVSPTLKRFSGEAEFLKLARQGPGYAKTHRPLVEFAKAHRLAVIAANAPRRLVTEYRKGEKSYADYRSGLSEADRSFLPLETTVATGAYLDRFTTLMGGERGSKLIKAQSLWVPAGERRLFALVDDERKERPASTSARIVVRGALVPESPPRARIEQLHAFDDYGKVVVQANLVNEADRIGKVVVISAFHDANGRPMTRPFQIIEIDKKQTKTVQFVGPPGSKTGTIFVGDVAY